MSRPLKVYVGRYDGRTHTLVAASSWKAARQAYADIGYLLPIGSMMRYGSVTGNPAQIVAGLAWPGTVLVEDKEGQWSPWRKDGAR